ncbi:polyadenylate-binding protein RBP45 [Phoenix dactylifera]|uniref:Polyadenylate-binding protein RBP45 n=1 Tax=Phoenix dactylifera TaxID=42345 RepID=A0A8B7CUJ8_PHODC|nr:polyadenylate-binding protein RBP45 [Phoenix dactylifera]
MMQPAGGMVQPPMVPPPMAQQHQMPPQQQAAPPPQQQWAMMPPPQYPQAQPQPMWNQQPSQIPPPVQPPPQLQPPPQYPVPTPVPAVAPSPVTVAAPQPASGDEIRTLWMGDLQYWMDESYVHGCFAHTGEVVSVKLIRDKLTGQLQGYGFIEFANRASAERVLQTYNGQMMPNVEQVFRLNWASAGEKRDDTPDYTIFVGDLAADVTDYILQETFRSHYSSVKGAKVVTDRITGRSKGYGFVRFGDVNEQTRAMAEMNGMFCSTRPMRIGPATSKKTMGVQPKASFQSATGTQSENDPNNTTIFVGGLDSNVTEEVLRQVFSPYGELVHVKIPVGKHCGFVQFANRPCAEEALLMLQGTQLGGQNIRLSWGRSPTNKQPQPDPNQWNGSYYGYGQGYEAYNYAQPPQDPNMYAYGAYPGYGNYQQQQ